jgi:hypothetical protein
VTDVRAILDTTAVLAHAAGSIHVGEVIAEVADEEATFGIPLPCLIEAARRADRDHISGVYLLEANRYGAIVPDRLERWRTIAGLARVLGRADLAAALLNAQDHGAYILTAEPDTYGDPERVSSSRSDPSRRSYDLVRSSRARRGGLTTT